MNLLDFYRQYPDEASCEEALRRSPGRAWIANMRCNFVPVQ